MAPHMQPPSEGSSHIPMLPRGYGPPQGTQGNKDQQAQGQLVPWLITTHTKYVWDMIYALQAAVMELFKEF